MIFVKLFIHIQAGLFENLKARILKSIITWSEMGNRPPTVWHGTKFFREFIFANR